MGRKAKPHYRSQHGHRGWYATVGGKKVHLVTGDKEATRAEAEAIFARLTGTLDPRVQRVVDVLRERPELTPAVLWVVESSNWLDLLRKSVPGYPAFDEREKGLVEVMLATAVRAGLTPVQVKAAGQSLFRRFDEPGIEAVVADTEAVRGWAEALPPDPGPEPNNPDGTADRQG